MEDSEACCSDSRNDNACRSCHGTLLVSRGTLYWHSHTSGSSYYRVVEEYIGKIDINL